MGLHVLAPGQFSLIVDRGRPRTRSLGMPVGGAADSFALSLGNSLVGNSPDAAALEICLVGPTLQADCSLACVVYGAPFDLGTDTQTLEVGKTFTLQSGELLHIGACAQGMRAYLCVRGGLRGETILHSQSALEPIRKGQIIECEPSSMPGRRVEIEPDWEATIAAGQAADVKVLRILPGAQASWFPADALVHPSPSTFHPPPPAGSPKEFRVSTASNRMGLRLEGPALPTPDCEMLSEPVCPGTVQVTRDGQCIILGVDGQTIGGYPKIAQVISADVDLLGQLRPNEVVVFQPVSLEEAERIRARKQEVIAFWVKRLHETLGGTP